MLGEIQSGFPQAAQTSYVPQTRSSRKRTQKVRSQESTKSATVGEALIKLPRQGVPMEGSEIGKGFSCSPRIVANPRVKSTEAIHERFGA